MIIPSRKLLALAAVPLVVVIGGRGAPAAVAAAWILMGALLLAFVADGVVAGRRPRPRLERQTPGQLHIDQRERIDWLVVNPNPFPLTLKLADQIPARARAEPRTLALCAHARSRVTVSYEVVCLERGAFAFGDLDYRVRGPLGLAWTQKRLPARLEIRCLPHLANAKAAELVELRALSRQAGSHRHRWRGAGTSFESLREYSAQDDIRWVDWKATARQGRPISRNFEIERYQQVVLLVDASRALSTFCGHRTKFDAMLEAAILVARAALNQGDGLGLVVFADKVDTYIHPRRDRAQLTTVTETLYAKQPRLVEPNFEAALLLAAKRNSRRTLFILLTDVTVIEASRRMLRYLPILAPRHLPVIVTIADETLEETELTEPRTAAEFYRVGVATGLMYERTLLLEEMRRAGAQVIDSPADQVGIRAIERYLDLKRRMRL